MNGRVDLDYMRYQQTMNKIARFAYKWINKEDASRGFVRKPDGLHLDAKYSLANVLEEARTSNIINKKEAKMLSHIIPCCRKDKSKRDFIE